MKRFVTTLVAASALAATVQAQQLNFELDGYRNADVPYPIEVQPMFVGTEGDACLYIPGRFNVKRGDAVLGKDPHGGLILQLLASLGQQHSHSGMAMSEGSLRHNTMVVGKLETVDSGLIPTRLRGTGDHSLRDGWPGVLDQTVEAAWVNSEFYTADGVVLSSTEDGENAGGRTAQLNGAADMFSRLRGFYRLFAYTDINWRDPFNQNADDGNMCAGSIFHAHRLAGNLGWVPETVRFYGNDVRQPAAQLLFDGVKREVKNDPDPFEGAIIGVNGLLGGVDLDQLATRAANQVVNCMGFDDCDNTAARWQNGVGDGASLSPDDLYNLAYNATLAAALAGVDSTYSYNTTRPLEVTGSYYCCKGQNPGMSFGDGYTTLTCSGG